MKFKILTLVIFLSIFFLVVTLAIGGVSEENDSAVLTATESKKWTSLFDRRGE